MGGVYWCHPVRSKRVLRDIGQVGLLTQIRNFYYSIATLLGNYYVEPQFQKINLAFKQRGGSILQ